VIISFIVDVNKCIVSWRWNMMEAHEKAAIDKGMKMLWIIWAPMLISLLIYIFVCHQLGEGFKGTGASNVPINLLRNIFFVVAAADLIVSYYLRRFTLKGRSRVAGVTAARGLFAQKQPAFVSQYFVAVIVTLALSESIGIYGLVLFLLGGGFKILYTFIGISAVAMVFYRPKREEMEKLAMAYKKQAGASSDISG